MLSGHAISLYDHNESNHLSSEDHLSEGDEVDDEEAELSRKVLYQASFEELKSNYLQYETVIWILISLLLILAWGIGILMLLYLPVRRYVLQKDVSSRKLYITRQEIVYKLARSSFLPFMGFTKTETRIPLHMVIDIIVEQGCLQAVYGIHTVRIENIARRKAAPVDELHVQGVFNPGLLRKVIVAEASKTIQGVGNLRSKYATEGDSVRMGSPTGLSPPRRFVSSTGKADIFTMRMAEVGGRMSIDMLLNKLEEVKQSVKKIEQRVAEQQSLTEIKDC